MEVLQQVRMIVELMGREGPTGEFAEVLELQVQDYGGNVYWSGLVEQYHPKRCTTGMLPAQIVATKIGKRGGVCADYMADYAIID